MADSDGKNSLRRKQEHDKVWSCELCSKSFMSRRSYNRHMQIHYKRNKYSCEICFQTFTRLDNLKRHKEGHKNQYKPLNIDSRICKHCKFQFNSYSELFEHISNMHSESKELSDEHVSMNTCKHCGLCFQNYSELFTHISNTHPLSQNSQQTGGMQSSQKNKTSSIEDQTNNINTTIRSHKTVIRSALQNGAQQVNILPNDDDGNDLLTFLSNIRSQMTSILKQRCRELKHIKWFTSVNVEMMRETLDGVQEHTHPHFRSLTYSLLSPEDLTDHDLNETFQKQFRSLDEYNSRGSGWILQKIVRMEVHTLVYQPLGASKYFELPKTLGLSKSIVNIKNRDEKCFLWSILASKYSVSKHAERVSKYACYESCLNMNGISYPVTINQISKFERQNQISVNVLGFEEDKFFPIRITKFKESTHHVNLLYLKKGNTSHYCFIKNLNRLLSRTMAKGRSHKFCIYCLQGFTSNRVLEKHLSYCSKYEAQNVELPVEGENDVLEFSDFSKQMKVPFVIYCDFEAFSEKLDVYYDNSRPKTSKIAQFKPCGFCYQIVCIDSKYTKKPVLYRGPNVSKTFLESILKEERYIRYILKQIKPLKMTNEDILVYNASTKCHICHGELKNDRVKDHCHLTGKFRGAAHNSCNLNYRYPSFIPIIFHSLRSFDAHIICESIGLFKQKDIRCIANSMEKYISFSLGNFRFIDSYQFMPDSLATLVTNLYSKGEQCFKLLEAEFPRKDQRKFLFKKGVYPYSWVDCEEKFQERKLPSKEHFYNDLTDSFISDDDYNHAQEVWRCFQIKNMGCYHDLYLKCDVLQLGCVFEEFRNESMKNYGIDPAHHFTGPGLAWSAALKMTECKLSLITDPDVYLFWESGLRGGIAQISNRYALANNGYIPQQYSANDENSYIILKDCNNLYGAAMRSYLPTGKMRFLRQDEINAFNISTIPNEGDVGYLLEIDLEYPASLHDVHSDYPVAPENITVPNEWLSKYSYELWKKINPDDPEMKRRVRTKKLICSLYDKTNYIAHYRNLKLYVSLGLKIKKIHRILEFQQSPWLRPYIDFNIEKRKLSNNKFERNFYKLMVNQVFGKSMENVRRYMNFQLIHTNSKLKKRVAKSSFKRCQIFNENLVGVEHKRIQLTLNKPIFCGMTILEISKCIMYDFHYNIMKPKYGNKIKLLFTDTDSLCYWIQTEDVYKDMYENKQYYDLSNYPINHFIFDTTNKTKPGVMKDECEG